MSCGKNLPLRRFCRPKLQVQRTCNVCYRAMVTADTSGKALQKAVATHCIPPPIAARIAAYQRKRKEVNEKKRRRKLREYQQEKKRQEKK